MNPESSKIDIWSAIEYARGQLDRDPHLANYMLRDYPEVFDAGLSDLAWAMHRGSPSRNDVLCLIEHLEKWLKEKHEP